MLGGERCGGEPGICDGRMPLSTGQTNAVPPKRCDTPCLAQGRPKLCNICMTVRCHSPDLVAPYRAILRYYRCDTPYRAILSRPPSNPPTGCDTPPWCLLLHRHISAIPHFATYRAILCDTPGKQARKSFAILSLKVSRDMKSIAAGPLSHQMAKDIGPSCKKGSETVPPHQRSPHQKIPVLAPHTGLHSADRKRVQRKRGHVKKRQKSSKIF